MKKNNNTYDIEEIIKNYIQSIPESGRDELEINNSMKIALNDSRIVRESMNMRQTSKTNVNILVKIAQWFRFTGGKGYLKPAFSSIVILAIISMGMYFLLHERQQPIYYKTNITKYDDNSLKTNPEKNDIQDANQNLESNKIEREKIGQFDLILRSRAFQKGTKSDEITIEERESKAIDIIIQVLIENGLVLESSDKNHLQTAWFVHGNNNMITRICVESDKKDSPVIIFNKEKKVVSKEDLTNFKKVNIDFQKMIMKIKSDFYEDS